MNLVQVRELFQKWWNDDSSIHTLLYCKSLPENDRCDSILIRTADNIWYINVIHTYTCSRWFCACIVQIRRVLMGCLHWSYIWAWLVGFLNVVLKEKLFVHQRSWHKRSGNFFPLRWQYFNETSYRMPHRWARSVCVFTRWHEQAWLDFCKNWYY